MANHRKISVQIFATYTHEVEPQKESGSQLA